MRNVTLPCLLIILFHNKAPLSSHVFSPRWQQGPFLSSYPVGRATHLVVELWGPTSHPSSPAQVITLSWAVGWWHPHLTPVGNSEFIWEAGHRVPGGAEGTRCCWWCWWYDDSRHHNLPACEEAPAHLKHTPKRHCFWQALVMSFLQIFVSEFYLRLCNDTLWCISRFSESGCSSFQFLVFKPATLSCLQNKRSASLVTKVDWDLI